MFLPLGALDPTLGGTSQLSWGDTAGSLRLCDLRVLQRSRWKRPCWVSLATPLNCQGLELPGREGVLSEHLGQLARPGLRLPPRGLGPSGRPLPLPLQHASHDPSGAILGEGPQLGDQEEGWLLPCAWDTGAALD